MLSESEVRDAEEDVLYGKDNRGDELPKDLMDRGSRLARLKECKERLRQEMSEKAAKKKEKIGRSEEHTSELQSQR